MSFRLIDIQDQMNIVRRLHRSARLGSDLVSGFKLKCGLELHTQLKTDFKLFSLSKTSFNEPPNSSISYFDVGLPGTMPKLNPEALRLALRLAVSLDSDINLNSSFDRKHYFYPDQPLGYQITQHYSPIAQGGFLKLDSRYDGIESTKKDIRIEQIQLEQDTGKTNYVKFDGEVRIDYNRANIPLIELVTKPDFETIGEVVAFIKKYQTLVKYLDVCTGDLETGAIRVDVNVSVNGGNRVEIKNLGSTSEVAEALGYEYRRQIECLKENVSILQETRSWDGKSTTALRSKEDALDYRYVPDSELPVIRLHSDIKKQVQESLPQLPDAVVEKLIASPFNIELKHAQFLVNNKHVLSYYYNLIESIKDIDVKRANNWLFHEVFGAFSKNNLAFDPDKISPSSLARLLHLIFIEKSITSASAKILLGHLVTAPNSMEIEQAMEQYDLGKPTGVSESDIDEIVDEICTEIIAANPDVIKRIKDGKHKSINYLIGQAMKETEGKVSSDIFAARFKALIGT